MINETAFHSPGGRLSARLRKPGANGVWPGVVICHGYSGNKEEYDPMAEALVNSGFATLQFDARGTGNSAGIFGHLLCATQWREDAAAAISFLAAQPFVDTARIGFAGSSMGGSTAVYIAAADSRVARVAALAPMASGSGMLRDNWRRNKSDEAYRAFMRRLYEAEAQSAMTGDVTTDIPVLYALGGDERAVREYEAVRAANPGMISRVSAESVLNSFERCSPIMFAPHALAPVMILHGGNDELVDCAEGRAVYENVASEKKLTIMEGAPHDMLGWAGHALVFAEVIEWFKRM